ncbi:MAG TPA: aminodeoxychorismate synthase component I [Bryobacteraceae bacterium]|jgi:para-aminobenzoate synthetase|nr:aminodeoxychorismate synthase component I [Bryobacteraceae bacterium]
MPALIIDNYDSFTFNLVHAVAAITGEMPIVVRNDEMAWDDIRRLEFSSVIISPGPGRPDRERDFGVSRDVILNATVPVLGVCLGHQGIACLFGGQVVQVPPVHGQASEIIHDGDSLFRSIPQRFSAIRYHSLAVVEPLPTELRKIAWSSDGTVMALRHATRPIWGVQFHPESVCTEYGVELLRNFLGLRGLAGRPAAAPKRCPTAIVCGAASFRRIELPHLPEVLFRELFSNEQHAFWLDSALVTERGRFSYMGASDEVHTRGFDEIKLPVIETADLPFPFTGGYVGYFGYECGLKHKHQSPYPDSVLLRVENFLAIDHSEDALYLVGAEPWLDEMERQIAAIQPSAIARWNGPAPVTRYSIPRQDYLRKIRECLCLIRAGESYELCLTNQVCVNTDIPALTYYETLRRTNPAPYSAFLQLGDIQIASTSPECFLRIDRERNAESRPIKGTMRRGRDAKEDACLRQLLANDTRFRAENLMIVDLVRHDLSRVCEVGSVHVPRLMEVETYETVHQLVSTIEGRLRSDVTTIDCIRALFPGGSMTGAPKLRSVELLDELEPTARGIYSGAIGYLGFNGAADLSIVIRTAVFRGGHASLGVGGAIVAQSDPEAEWDEMELKAQALLRAFELA